MRKPSRAAIASQDRDDVNIARAVAYSVFLHLSPKERYQERVKTVAEAQKLATMFYSIPNRYGRQPLIYAITPEGWSVPLRTEDQVQPDQIQSHLSIGLPA